MSVLDNENDRLDELVRKIFEIIDTYHIEWQAEDIKILIENFCDDSLHEQRSKRFFGLF